jgi:hypothetical protein
MVPVVLFFFIAFLLIFVMFKLFVSRYCPILSASASLSGKDCPDSR